MTSQNHGHQEPTEAQYQQYITELWTASNYDNNDVFSLIELHDVFVHYDTNSEYTTVNPTIPLKITQILKETASLICDFEKYCTQNLILRGRNDHSTRIHKLHWFPGTRSVELRACVV